MADSNDFNAETVQQLAAVYGTLPIASDEFPAVAELLRALVADLQALRRMNVGGAEPASLDSPAEPSG